MKPLLHPVAALATALAAALGACSRGAAGAAGPREPERVIVSLASVTHREVERTVDVVGTLRGELETTLAAKVPGRVATVLKDIGDRAAAGEPLVEIERRDYEVERQRADMTLHATLAQLGLSDLPAGEFDPEKVPTVVRARAEVANAAARLARGKELANAQPPLISGEALADLETARDVAASNVDVEILKARSLLAEARQHQAELEMADWRLRDTVVRPPEASALPRDAVGSRPAPTGYAVMARLVSPGEYVREGTPVYRLVALDVVELRATVPERFAGAVRAGQTVRVTVEAQTDVFTGRIVRVSPDVDPVNRTFEVRVALANDRGLLKPGSFARGAVVVGTDVGVTFVPIDAIATAVGTRKVFTVEGGVAVEHVVETGVRREGAIEIRPGLPAGTEVVVSGAARLANGARVEVRIASQPASRPASSPASRREGGR